jgi:hypothetical protein
VNGAHALLILLLVVNGVQAAAAFAAFAQGGMRAKRGEHHLARYSHAHALLLLAAAAALSVPPVLGLAGVVSTSLAVWVTLPGEVLAFTVARRRLPHLHAQAHGSPGPSTTTAAPASSATAEGTAEAGDS